MNSTEQTTAQTTTASIGVRSTASRWSRLRLGAAGLTVAALMATTACGTVGQAEDATTSTAASSSTETASDTSAESTASDSSAEAQELAEAFAATLDADQLAELQQDYTYENATNWSNFPQALLANGMGGGPGSDGTASSSTGRVGLSVGELDDEQRAALEDLLAAALGGEDNEGYDEAMSILAADDYLAQNYGGSDYGSDNYYIAFLGEVSDTGTWELQFGGHHLAVSNTFTDGELVSATPSFRGTEPTGEFTLDGEAYDPLSQETAAFTALAESLTASQLSEAATDQSDLLLGPGADGEFPEEAEGVKVSELSDEQRQLVLDAIETYVDDLPEDEAAEYMATYEAEIDDTYVSFSGSTDFSQAGDYLRIDGPSVWIELAMQNGVATSEPHIHSVWRDSETDCAGLTSDDTTTAAQS